MGSFFLSSLKFFQPCSISPPIRLSCSEHNLSPLLWALPYSTSCCQGPLSKSLPPHSAPGSALGPSNHLPTPANLRSEIPIPEHRVWGPSQSYQHPHPGLFPPFTIDFIHIWFYPLKFPQVLESTRFFWCLSFICGENIFVPAYLVKSYPSLQVQPGSHLFSWNLLIHPS